MRYATLALLFVAAVCRVELSHADDAPPKFSPTSDYEVRTIEGWPVHVHVGFVKGEPELSAAALEHLRFQLYQIVHRLPAAAVDKLRKVPIWLEDTEPHHPCAAYHPDAGWLRDHDMNTDKARCVEIANARNFLTWTVDQPWMVLHELAHAYHDQFLDGGFDNAELAEVFKASLAADKYASVQRISGKVEKAYATTNVMEYFAEATEAFFGTNDFYPYVRSELREYDPRMHELLEKLWLVK